jgi:transposase
MAKQGNHTRMLRRRSSVPPATPSVIEELGGLSAVFKLTAALRCPAPVEAAPGAVPASLRAAVCRPQRKPWKVTVALRREIWRLHGKGLSQRQIALAVGLSKSKCQKVLKTPEAPRSERQEKRRALAAQAAALRGQGYGLNEIGRRLKVHTDTVHRLLNEHAEATA